MIDNRGNRDNTGKPQLSMILEARHAMEGIAAVLEFGKKKYSRGNWRKGLTHAGICDSLLRHMSAYLAGEDTDNESGLPHVDHVACNAMFLSEMVTTRPDLDDRSQITPAPTSDSTPPPAPTYNPNIGEDTFTL